MMGAEYYEHIKCNRVLHSEVVRMVLLMWYSYNDRFYVT